jgi:hypothetical protein
MDQYSKTTELDVSEVSGIEDNAPKKSKAWRIVSIFLCLIIAFGIWIYVMEIDNEVYEKEYKDVSFEKITTDNYVISSADTVDVTVKGLKRDIADIKKSDIIIYIDTDEIDGVGKKEVDIKCKLPDGSDVKIENISDSKITVEIRAK